MHTLHIVTDTLEDLVEYYVSDDFVMNETIEVTSLIGS